VRRIGRKDTLDFGLVMESIKAFLLPVYEAICIDEDFILKWDHEAKQWTRFDFEEQ